MRKIANNKSQEFTNKVVACIMNAINDTFVVLSPIQVTQNSNIKNVIIRALVRHPSPDFVVNDVYYLANVILEAKILFNSVNSRITVINLTLIRILKKSGELTRLPEESKVYYDPYINASHPINTIQDEINKIFKDYHLAMSTKNLYISYMNINSNINTYYPYWLKIHNNKTLPLLFYSLKKTIEFYEKLIETINNLIDFKKITKNDLKPKNLFDMTQEILIPLKQNYFIKVRFSIEIQQNIKYFALIIDFIARKNKNQIIEQRAPLCSIHFMPIPEENEHHFYKNILNKIKDYLTYLIYQDFIDDEDKK